MEYVDGETLDTVEIPGGETQRPTISPDGRRLAFTQIANGGSDIFVYDLATRSTRRLRRVPSTTRPPCGRPIAAN